MLTDAWYPLRHHAAQYALWRDPRPFIGVAAGRGSGKTELARRKIVRFLPVVKPWSEPIYVYMLPTYQQAKRIAWREIKKLIPASWIKESNESDLRIETVYGSTLYVVGMDKPQRIEGIQIDGCVIDESCDQKPGMFDTTVMPMLSHRNAWCMRIGVPKRFGISRNEFKDFCDKGQSGIDPETVFYSWSSEDILTEAQILRARSKLSEKDYNEQYRANWEEAGGSVFHSYNDIFNIDDSVAIDRNSPLLIGSDFNVDPMAWVIGQRTQFKLHIHDELFVRNTNTQATLDILWKKYKEHKAGFQFYGDATGRARKTAATSASQSDYLMIKNHPMFKTAQVFYPKSNPAVSDRFAATNAMFCNAVGDRRCTISSRCVNLRRDCQARGYIPGTREPDDRGDVGHITDALGYLIWRLFPLGIPQSENSPKMSAA